MIENFAQEKEKNLQKAQRKILRNFSGENNCYAGVGSRVFDSVSVVLGRKLAEKGGKRWHFLLKVGAFLSFFGEKRVFFVIFLYFLGGYLRVCTKTAFSG